MSMRCLAVWLVAVSMVCPVLAQDTAQGESTYPDYRPAQDRLQIRYAPEVGTTISYRFEWSFDLDVPLSGTRKSEGSGVLHLTCIGVDENGVATLEAEFEGFRNRMEGATYDVGFPEGGLTLLVDPSRRVLWTSEGLESIGAMLMKSFFAVAFPQSRLEVGATWSNDLSLLATEDEPRTARHPFWPSRPRVSDLIPDQDPDSRRWPASHVLAAIVPVESEGRVAGIISDVDVAFSLEAYGIGTAGRLGVEMHSEYFEKTGTLRWALAKGTGRLQTLAVVSVPVTNVVVEAAIWDPRTGESLKPLQTYVRPPLPEEEVRPHADPSVGDTPEPETTAQVDETAEEEEAVSDDSPGSELPPDHPLRRGRPEPGQGGGE